MGTIAADIRAGIPSLGIWLVNPGVVSAELLGRQGLDWVLVDLQHGGVTPDSLIGILQALELGGTPALVRPQTNAPADIMRALDMGAAGVIVPLVTTAAEARAAARAVRYPPQGDRSFGPLRAARSVAEANSELLCFAMIETAEGLATLDQIAATPGLDGLFVGPSDLALAIGAEDSSSLAPEIWAAMERVIAACDRAGIAAGTVSRTEATATQLVDMGMLLLTIGSDIGYLKNGAANDVKRSTALRDRCGRPSRSSVSALTADGYLT